MGNKKIFEKYELYIVIMTIIISIFFILNMRILGMGILVVYSLAIIYKIKIFNTKNNEWEEFLKDLSSNIDISSKNILKNSPFPLVIIESKGNILWYNKKFTTIFNKDKILGLNIKNIIKDVSLHDIKNNEKKIYKYINIEDKYYNILIHVNNNKLNMKNSMETIILYFYDVTYEMKLIKDNEKNEYAIALIEVDNLDEVLKTTDDDNALLLSAEIERNIKNYAQSLNSSIVKYASNKYMMLTNVKYIQDEINKNFEILDEVRDINYGNKLMVTLSIGIGIGGKSPIENRNFSSSAKELALSRGGDQVVIKNGDSLSFFGGKTKEIEKRTKVKARVIAHALVNLINESSSIYIMGHSNLDMDSLGAAIGLRSVINAMGKKAFIILEDINSGIENAINKIKEKGLYDDFFISKNNCVDKYDQSSLLILVDVNSAQYVQDKDILNYLHRIVVIDHHRKSSDFVKGAILSYIEPYASSTCELVTEMIQYMIDNPKKSISAFEAQMILTGIYIDTKNFYFKTGVRTFEAAAYLKSLGADIVEVKKMFSGNFQTYLKKAEIMSLAKIKDNIAIILCPPHIQDNILVAQVADELLNISEVKASFVVAKIKEDVFISGRSLGDINVQIILETLGGGGHMTIAGAKLENIPINEANIKLRKAIYKYLREGEE